MHLGTGAVSFAQAFGARLYSYRSRRSSQFMLSFSPIVDPARDVLNAQVRHFSTLVGWATLVVAIGVALEGVELLHDAIGWIKRRRIREKELAVRKELMEIFPAGEIRLRSESNLDHPRWVKRFTRIGLILVVVGVLAEWRCGSKLEDAHNAVHEYDIAKLTEAAQKAGDAAASAKTAHEEADAVKGIADEARADAKDALAKAQAAQSELAHAEADAGKAQAAASRALSTADKAESHLAEAVKRANELTEQLKRLTTSRTLPASPTLVSSLKTFKDMEYMFTGVCGDTECINLLRDIEKVLDLAEWRRVKAPHTFPGLVLWGERKDDDGVGFDFEPGTKVSLDSVQGEEIGKLPLASLPQ
jgi:hypothetical protein